MYLLADTETTLPCSITDAFDYVADLENFARWFPGVESITATDELAVGVVGKSYLETVILPIGATLTIPVHVCEACAPVRLATEGNLALLRPRMEIDLSPVDAEHCVIRWRMYSRVGTRLLQWTLLPVIAIIMQRRAKIGLRNLAQLLGADRGRPQLGCSL
ncbi:SRPBCC family protein [Nocardia sp. NPDC057272]|uniref:SRPBCC family protein n=1 Tax=Nocardia sp. NPDC057272 TaxID=3346079 RepID=UPI0036276EE9